MYLSWHDGRECERAESKMKASVDALKGGLQKVVMSAPGLDFSAGRTVKRKEERRSVGKG